MTRRVVSVVGTRPNVMKMAPVVTALAGLPEEFESLLVHTGQHYDDRMSTIFLEELGLGQPDFQLGVGSGTHAVQMARVMERLEPLLEDLRPSIVLVPGDVNSTLAAALTASRLRIPIGHIEAGLRSFDRTMPEETNRVLTDQISDLLFTHSPEAHDNLVREGIRDAAIHYVGNTMIDSLMALRHRFDPAAAASEHGLRPGEYLLVTLHRPALVDGPLLDDAMHELSVLSRTLPVAFPMHPRTRSRVGASAPDGQGIRLLEPLGYLEFMGLMVGAAGVLTDSGGIQEETTVLGVPCFTLRDNTERPVTVDHGTNHLLGLDPGRIADIPDLLSRSSGRQAIVPPLWDGRAARRVVEVLRRELLKPGGLKWA